MAGREGSPYGVEGSAKAPAPEKTIPRISSNTTGMGPVLIPPVSGDRQVENLRYSRVKPCATGLLALKREIELHGPIEAGRESANCLLNSCNGRVNILTGRITIDYDVIIVFYRRAF